MTGFFAVMMFGLPAAALAIIAAAKPEKRKSISGMFIGIALTSFLTGITEPIYPIFSSFIFKPAAQLTIVTI
jgi:N-acetylglucosamine PTS system EIICBA or EIICB component